MVERTRGLLRPKFTASELATLKATHGLTDAQFSRLQLFLPSFLDRMCCPSKLDVVAELREFASHIGRAQKRAESWRLMWAPSAGKEALGHLNIASATMSRDIAPDDGTWPVHIVATELLELIHVSARQARAAVAAQPKRSRHPASPQVVAKIVEQLKWPPDEKSVAAFARLRLTATSKAESSLRGVSDTVFEAVYRCWNDANGNPETKPPTSEQSIKAWAKQLPKQEKPRRGRPKGRSP